ncbi:MAG: septal ring lytic transglycosylase RlpA family protein [Pseudomonadota bacterium]
MAVFDHVDAGRCLGAGYGARAVKWAALGLLAFLSACASTPSRTSGGGSGPAPHYKVGKPYKVAGRWYHPKVDEKYDRVGEASWYGQQFHGRRTANGEVFNMNRLSAAHTTLPMPSLVRVTNLENGRSAVLRVNDRGPFARNRIIDLSRAAARKLGFERQGTARVRVRYVGEARLADAAPFPGEETRDRIAEVEGGAAADPIGDILQSLEGAESRAVQDREMAAIGETPSAAMAAGGDGMTPGAMAASETDSLSDDETTEWDPSAMEAVRVAADAPETESRGIIDTAKVEERFGGDGRFVIEVVALSMRDDLQSVRRALSGFGALQVSRDEIGETDAVYRITMGPFDRLARAEEALAKVKNAGYEGAKIISETP